MVEASPIPAGKLPVDLLAEVVGAIAADASEVRIGPAIGEDAAAIDLPAGVTVVATDPITLTGSEVGGLAVVINANDVAVTGARPRWFLATVLLPLGSTESDVRAIFAGMGAALERTGAILVGGHTEVTGAVTQPVVVGQMLGHREDGAVVATSGARPGDVVVQVGPVPVEGAAVLATEARDRLAKVPDGVLEAAAGAATEPGISVVEPALAAAELGVSALHDPTEGGLAAALHELARASQVVLAIDRGAVRWFEPGVEVCAALDADPWATLASGCVIAAAPAGRSGAVRDALVDRGFEAALIGEVLDAHGRAPGVVASDGSAIVWPARDEVARVLG